MRRYALALLMLLPCGAWAATVELGGGISRTSNVTVEDLTSNGYTVTGSDGSDTWQINVTSIAIPSTTLDISTTTDGSGNSLMRFNGTSSIIFNDDSGDLDIRWEADGNANGVVFDASANTNQGGVAIGLAAPSSGSRLHSQISAGSAIDFTNENTSTSGYAVLRAKANAAAETFDHGVGGSAVGGDFADYGYLYTNTGLSGIRFFTNGTNVAATINNSQQLVLSTNTYAVTYAWQTVYHVVVSTALADTEQLAITQVNGKAGGGSI